MFQYTLRCDSPTSGTEIIQISLHDARDHNDLIAAAQVLFPYASIMVMGCNLQGVAIW